MTLAESKNEKFMAFEGLGDDGVGVEDMAEDASLDGSEPADALD